MARKSVRAAAAALAGACIWTADVRAEEADAPAASRPAADASAQEWHDYCRAHPRDEALPKCRDAFREVDRSAWRRGAVLSVVVENDALVGPDRDYTNGIGAVLSLPPRTNDTDNLVDRINGGIDDRFHALFRQELEPGATYRGAWRFAQHLYTPEDLLAPIPDPADRPYAAWTYLGYAQTSERGVMRRDGTGEVDPHRLALSTTQIDVGMIGPSAGGEAIQRWFHELIDAEVDPQGWGYQLADEPGIVLRHERKLITRCDDCLGPVDVAFDRFGGFAIGNVDTSASVGGALRVGFDFGWDHGPPRLRPSLDGASYFAHDGARWGGYAFAGVTARWVGRNIFLDGNTLFDSPSVPKKPFVGDVQVGGVALLGPVKLTLSHVVRSEEFYGQGRETQFDSLAASFRF